MFEPNSKNSLRLKELTSVSSSKEKCRQTTQPARERSLSPHLTTYSTAASPMRVREEQAKREAGAVAVGEAKGTRQREVVANETSVGRKLSTHLFRFNLKL